MSELIIKHEGMILDACCVNTLYASGQMEEILSVITPFVTIAAYVYEEESRYIYTAPKGDPKRQKVLIDLRPLVDKGLLSVISMSTESEARHYVDFAFKIGDDGEAITGAIAYHHNWAIATDDKRATKIFRREIPQIQLLSTLELLKHWADTINAPFAEVRLALQKVLYGATWRPNRKDRLYAWWVEHYEGT